MSDTADLTPETIAEGMNFVYAWGVIPGEPHLLYTVKKIFRCGGDDERTRIKDFALVTRSDGPKAKLSLEEIVRHVESGMWKRI